MNRHAQEKFRFALLAGSILLGSLALLGQQAPPDHSKMDMPGMDMSGQMDHSMSAMASKHMDMGPHMKMTELRPAQPGDQQRADQIVQQLRRALEKYKDYRAAEEDGFQEFLPNVPTPMKHFTNYKYAAEAQFTFNPDHPTSLLYEKSGGSYKLIGAMYTAPRRYTEDDLDKRVPLSVAQWHEHVNLCRPPKGQEREQLSAHPRFGLAGSISTQEECEGAGGTFYPIIYSWMVHVYPFEQTPAEIWSVERQHGGHRD